MKSEERHDADSASHFLSRPFLGAGFHVGELLDSAVSPPACDPPDGLRAYVLGEVLGHGRHATVHVAEQRTPVARRVAIKILHARLGDRSAEQRFRREQQTLARLEHPNIARLYEAGTSSDGRAHLVMEFVDGAPVDKVAATRSLTVDQRVRVVRDACGAVHHAHMKGIVHRDLKPGNVLLTTVDGALAVKVIDFGIAKLLAKGPDDVSLGTIVGSIVGTIPYMAPEQLEGRVDDVDVRSDVYAMGVLLYELVAGRRPHELSRLGPLDAARIVRDERAPSLRTLAPTTSLDLDRVVAKAIRPRPDDRYQSMAEFAADLDRVLADEPVLARTPTAFESLRRTVRRHPAAAVLAASLVAALVATTVLAVSLAASARRAAEKSRERIEEYLAAVIPLESLIGAFDVRRRLIGLAEQASAELVQQRPGDTETLRLRARVLVALSKVEREDAPNGLDAAREQRREALLLWDTVMASPGATLDDRRERAIAIILVGDIEKEEGRFESAKEKFELALAEHRALVAADPSDMGAARQIGYGFERLGELAAYADDQATAAAHFQAHLTEAGRLAQAFPADESLRWDLCMARAPVIQRLVAEGDFDPAERMVDASTVDAMALVAGSPGHRPYQVLLALCWVGRANLLTAMGRADEALPIIARGRAMLEENATRDPSQIETVVALNGAIITEAKALHALGRIDEASSLADTARLGFKTLLTARPGNPAYLLGQRSATELLRHMGR